MLIVRSFDNDAEDGGRHRGGHAGSGGVFASLLAAIEQPQIVPRPRTLSVGTGGAIALLGTVLPAGAPGEALRFG